MIDAQGEEFKHFSMDLEFLLRRTPPWREIARGVLFQPGDIVFNEGDPPEHLYVVADGEVEVIWVAPDGTEEVQRTLGPSRVLGELGILGGHARTATARAAQESTLWAIEREAFGKPIGKFQHNRFLIAEMATEARIAQVFVDDCIRKHLDGKLDATLASMAKWWTTELQKRVVDAGVQLHGGYGYLDEYPISKAYTDSRIQTIYGGTTEIQKEIIGRSLGL